MQLVCFVAATCRWLWPEIDQVAAGWMSWIIYAAYLEEYINIYIYIYAYQLQSQPLLPGNEANVTICRRRCRCRLVFATQCATATTNCIQMKQFALKADDGEAGKTNFQLEIAYFYSTYICMARCIRQRQTWCKSVRFVCRMALELDLIEFCPHWLNITHTPRCTECNWTEIIWQLLLLFVCLFVCPFGQLTDSLMSDPGARVQFNANKLKAFHHVCNNKANEGQMNR